MEKEKRFIEAALFISARPISLEEFRTLTGIGALGYLKKLISELQKEYIERKSAIEIIEQDEKYIMRVRNEYVERVKNFAQESEISRGALRTLAYVSKHDGILKSQLVRIMGSKTYQHVKELVHSGFIKQQKKGRSSKLILTDKFRTYFERKNAEEEI